MGTHLFNRLGMGRLQTRKFMKHLLFLLVPLFLSVPSMAQTDTTEYVFGLDVIRTDSFFLNSTSIQKSTIEPRPVEFLTPKLFRDTAEFSAYINGVALEFDAIAAQYVALSNRKAAVYYHVERLKCLRDSVFYGLPCSGVGARMLALPPPQEIGMEIPQKTPAQTPDKKPSTKGKKEATTTTKSKKKNR